MHKLFVPTEEIGSGHICLTGENHNHIKVLRLREGEQVTVCDGCGTDYFCILESMEKDRSVLKVQSSGLSSQEPRVACRIYVGFPKADKLEHIIQKATELGASEIIAFPAARSISRPDDRNLSKKLERWQKIALSAAEQCGRGRVPEVRLLPSYEAALLDAAACDRVLLFYENEEQLTLRKALESGSWESVAVITGPEGGFEQKEVAAAAAAGALVCTLGTRILRCETAPLCALSAIMYAAGEF